MNDVIVLESYIRHEITYDNTFTEYIKTPANDFKKKNCCTPHIVHDLRLKKICFRYEQIKMHRTK